MNKDNVCKYCKSNINKEAVICPHCKKDLRSWWRRHPILTIIFILFITPILISAIGDKTFKTDTSQNTVDKIKKERENFITSGAKGSDICKKYEDWSVDDCKNLAERNVWIGMSLDMLKYLRGNPDSSNPSNYGRGIRWQWCWHDRTPRCFYGGDDGIITSYN